VPRAAVGRRPNFDQTVSAFMWQAPKAQPFWGVRIGQTAGMNLHPARRCQHLRRPPRRSLHSIDGPRLIASSSPWRNNRTLPFDRSHPVFRKCIQVWAVRTSQTFHTPCRQDLPEFSAELGIAILQNVPTAVQISQLLHSSNVALRATWLIQLIGDCRDEHPPAAQVF
jgi:hypothetical protein